jgi:DNA mismatch repair ATPase MutS
MRAVDRPSARQMIPLLDPREILGINPTLKGVSNKADSLHAFYCQRRRLHPTKVLLVRVGDFYETFGYCAVLLVQYAGLNPMGTKIARAGCPAVNLRRTLADLTAAGGYEHAIASSLRPHALVA